jgi:TM2 domain-containing membrane protein YozV
VTSDSDGINPAFLLLDKTKEEIMGSGSCGNVLAALASFFIPGLGQLLQGRWLLAGFMFVLTALLWLILLGWVIHLWSIIDAALFEQPGPSAHRQSRYYSYDHRRVY